MKKSFILLALLMLPVSAKADTVYLQALPDIPLMSGMKEAGNSGIVFDKAEGRIVEESVETRGLSEKTIMEFYSATLPQLGWKQVSPRRFLRNHEQLIVSLDKLQSEGMIGFALSPITP